MSTRRAMSAKMKFLPQKRPRKKPNHSNVRVFDEAGNLVYNGPDRRAYRELVFFDSGAGIRRFALQPHLISRRRRKQLRKTAPKKEILGRSTFPSTRSTKHREKRP